MLVRTDPMRLMLRPVPVQQVDAKVWLVDLARATGLQDLAWSFLSTDEQERVRGMLRPAQRDRRTLTLAFTRVWLSTLLNVAPRQVKLVRSEEGRPVLQMSPLDAAAPLSFSVSHSADRLLLAASTAAAVGIDIECQRPDRPVVRLAQWLELPRSTMDWVDEGGADSPLRFYQLWTASEAWVKASSNTLADGLRKVPVRVDAQGRLSMDSADGALELLDVGAGYCATLATVSRPVVDASPPKSQ